MLAFDTPVAQHASAFDTLPFIVVGVRLWVSSVNVQELQAALGARPTTIAPGSKIPPTTAVRKFGPRQPALWRHMTPKPARRAYFWHFGYAGDLKRQ